MNQHTLQYKKHLIALAISSVLFSSQAFAATEPQQQSDKKQLLDLERIVVTGSGGRGQTKLESSVSITTLSAEDLAREAPLGTADLLETVPGFWVEDSSGETNNNVAPRGLRGGEVDYGEPIRLTLSGVGLRYQTAHSHFSGALFTTHFDPLPFTVYRGATNPQHAILINTQTTGVEFEYEYRYNASWQLKAIGVLQDAGFYGIPASLPQSQFNGNQITRTPELQLRLTPQYSQGPITAALTFSYIGERYSDVANRFALPAYHTWDLFSEVALNEHLKVQLEIKNLTNTLGLTEGNPRDDLSHQEALFYARPIFGRTITLSMSYEF